MATTSTQSFQRIALHFGQPATYIILQNGSQNIIDLQMMDELLAGIEQVNTRDEVSVLVLAGGEKAFSAGVDVAAHTPEQVPTMLGKFHSVIRALVATRKVTVAAVRGNCLGGGAEIPLVCDLVYTNKGAKWGFPEIQLACFPPIAAVALAAVVGQKRAAELVLSGRIISGEYAAQIGLANAAVDDSELQPTLDAAVARLSKLSPAALALAKKALYGWDAMHFDKGLARAEQIYLDQLMKTEDAREGIASFLEKRQPVWKGR